MSRAALQRLNSLDAADARAELGRCCGSSWWSERVERARPYADAEALGGAADAAFDAMPDEAWLEALNAHPQIGDLRSLKMRFAGNREWSGGEQAGAAAADEETLRELAAGNERYETRFGHRFVVCATGLTAAEMLARLRSRLDNDPAAELRIAAAEQRKITHLRLAKLLVAIDP